MFNFRNATEIKAYATLETAILEHYFELTAFANKECFFRVVEAFAKCKKKEDLDMTEISLRTNTDADIRAKADQQKPSISNLVHENRSSRKPKNKHTVVSPLDAEVIRVQERMHNSISVQKSRRLYELTADVVTLEQEEQLAAFGREIACGVKETGRLLTT